MSWEYWLDLQAYYNSAIPIDAVILFLLDVTPLKIPSTMFWHILLRFIVFGVKIRMNDGYMLDTQSCIDELVDCAWEELKARGDGGK